MGLDYCHRMGVVNRDIKLENTLLDASPKPLVKITDFGYCKASNDSLPKSKVGTPGYTGMPHNYTPPLVLKLPIPTNLLPQPRHRRVVSAMLLSTGQTTCLYTTVGQCTASVWHTDQCVQGVV